MNWGTKHWLKTSDLVFIADESATHAVMTSKRRDKRLHFPFQDLRTFHEPLYNWNWALTVDDSPQAYG